MESANAGVTDLFAVMWSEAAVVLQNAAVFVLMKKLMLVLTNADTKKRFLILV